MVAFFALALGPDLTAGSKVGVYLEFEQSPSQAAVDAMRRQATDVLKQIGFDLAWRLVSENRGDEPFEHLVVVRFVGRCASLGTLRPTQAILVLGSTLVSDGQVLPYSQVLCDQVRRVLPDVEFAVDRARGNLVLGRALGRVVAHELYHVLLGTTHHQAEGLAKGVQCASDLTSEDFSFEADSKPLQF
jgi:hypothetical protein